MKFDFDFNPPPPAKCVHCGFIKGRHRAGTFQCPAKWSRSRIGFTHFENTVFEPKPIRKVAK